MFKDPAVKLRKKLRQFRRLLEQLSVSIHLGDNKLVEGTDYFVGKNSWELPYIKLKKSPLSTYSIQFEIR